MTDDELHDAIQADAAAKALADSGNDSGCATRMAAVLPPVLASYRITDRGIFAAFPDDPDAAEDFMAALEALAPTTPKVKRALAWLEPANGGVDLAFASVRSMLDQLASASVLDGPTVSTLKALAERPAVVTASDVSRAWARHRPEGRIA